MALDTGTLKSEILNAFTSQANNGNTSASETASALAEAIANAVEKYVKSGTVKVTANTGQIAVQGSATAQANVSPITIEGVVE